MSQQALFDLGAGGDGPDTPPLTPVSRRPHDGPGRRLVSMAGQVHQATEPLERARLASLVRDLAEEVVKADIAEANRRGMTWREIGAGLGVPFQTLHRRYGGG
jgi:hypothetical protein